MPSIAAAPAPFPGALYNPQLNAIGGARSVSQQPSSGLKSPEHLEELWNGRGSPMRMENNMTMRSSPAPAPWMSEFNAAGPAVAGGSSQMQSQPGLRKSRLFSTFRFLLSLPLFSFECFPKVFRRTHHTWEVVLLG